MLNICGKKIDGGPLLNLLTNFPFPHFKPVSAVPILISAHGTDSRGTIKDGYPRQ